MALKLTFNPFTGTFDYITDTAAFSQAVALTIASGVVYTLAANTQTLAAVQIEVDGQIDSDGGVLIEVA